MKFDGFEALISYCKKRPDVLLFTVDGESGAGKSTVARSLSAELGIEHLDLDSLVTRKRVPYYKAVDRAMLLTSLTEIISQGRRTVVSGLLIDKLVDKGSASPELRIYIKKMARSGLWNLGEDINLPPAETNEHRLYREVVAYHRKYRPMDRCDCLLELIHD